MTTIAVRAERVGKQYRLGQIHDDFPTLRGALTGAIGRIGRRRPPDARRDRRFWALRDVSFELHEGDTVGFIGRNGAGKSTLLKILSRITEPTAGEVTLRGRVGSLLEVGTGFQPELTGRQNVYLNGAILGMKKAEIDRKFDEIVAFSEVERFLDTPVKYYSSGMQVRLAFAVAAHLETDILIADEVLAVGDSAFQQKCIGKMASVARQGRTVLFVSHNLAAVRSLCTRGILLRDGVVALDGQAPAVIDEYLRGLEQLAAPDLLLRSDRGGTGAVRLTRVEISIPGSPAAALATGRPARIVLEVDEVVPGLSCSFTVYDALGQPVTAFDSSVDSPHDARDARAAGRFICEIDELLLLPGRYRVNAAISRGGEMLDHLEAAAFIEVDHGYVQGRPAPPLASYGSMAMPHRWTTPA
jgi:lipopolysaccharide transport system ATP-binding protein